MFSISPPKKCSVDFYSTLKIMRKLTKEVLWIFLGFILLIFILDFFLLKREGLSVTDMGKTTPPCEYKYLAPTPKDENGNVKEWNIATQDNYIKKMNEVNPPSDSKDKLDRTKLSELQKILNISEEEGNYYAKNGQFPLNPFIINTLKNDEKVKAKIEQLSRESKVVITADNINKMNTVRMIYARVIAPTESTDSSSLTLARQIFDGKTVAPNCEEPEGASTSSFSDADKQKLKEVCKNL
jgi:hypothetical protein